MNKYGFPVVSEKKFIQFVKGIESYKQKSVRIMLFASFIGIDTISEGNTEVYLKGLYYFINGRYLFFSLLLIIALEFQPNKIKNQEKFI